MSLPRVAATPLLRRCAGVLLAAAVCAGCSHAPAAPGAAPAPVPRLVLVVAIDQGIPERLDPALPGGLGRLAREGRVFVDAAHAHARTETCPGHVVLLTGLHPGRAGIPGNRFIVNGTREVRYCVQEDGPDGRLLTAPGEVDAAVLDAAIAASGAGRSPRQIRGQALGDWMKARWPEARVFTVSAKDRAAIALGGQRPDAAYWLDRAGSGAFTTSRYYLERLPDWVAAWTRDRVLEGIPETWDYRDLAFEDPIREDDYVHESERFSRTAPHPLVDRDAAKRSLAPVEASPWLDSKTLDFARELVEQEGLGTDEVPDLLGVSLSATDLVGHHYGPYSQEAWAATVRLDADLGAFLEALEARVGAGRLLVVLSSDHGVLPLPEWWATHGGVDAPCPVSEGRVDPRPLAAALTDALVAAFGEGWLQGWVQDGPTIGFDAALMEREGVSLAEVLAVARGALEAHPSIERTWTRAELMQRRADTDPFAALYRNQLAAGRGGDLFAQPASGCLITPWPTGTSHGSPYPYDRDVPLVFFGPGIEPGRVPGRAAPVDVAPTLAHHIGLEPPGGLDGRVLPLSPVVAPDAPGPDAHGR